MTQKKFYVTVDILVLAENEQDAENIVDRFLLDSPIPVEDFGIITSEEVEP